MQSDTNLDSPSLLADPPMYDLDPKTLPILEWANLMSLTEGRFVAYKRLRYLGIDDDGLRFDVVQMIAVLFRFSEHVACKVLDAMPFYSTLKDAAMDIAAYQANTRKANL